MKCSSDIADRSAYVCVSVCNTLVLACLCKVKLLLVKEMSSNRVNVCVHLYTCYSDMHGNVTSLNLYSEAQHEYLDIKRHFLFLSVHIQYNHTEFNVLRIVSHDLFLNERSRNAYGRNLCLTNYVTDLQASPPLVAHISSHLYILSGFTWGPVKSVSKSDR